MLEADPRDGGGPCVTTLLLLGGGIVLGGGALLYPRDICCMLARFRGFTTSIGKS
jgi:hypothetical protein